MGIERNTLYRGSVAARYLICTSRMSADKAQEHVRGCGIASNCPAIARVGESAIFEIFTTTQALFLYGCLC